MPNIDCDFHICEQKTAGVTIEERGDGREVIVGHAAVFYSESDPGTEYRLAPFMRERIGRGAFDGAMKRPDDVRALRDHDKSLLLGRTANGTLRLSVDSRGLFFEIDPDTTTVAQDTRKMLRRGDINGSSFGFIVDSEMFEDDGDEIVRNVLSVNPLVDVGPQTFPAYLAADSGISRRKQGMFGERLKHFIGEHRDEEIGRRLETRAAKFGIVVPKEKNPETIAQTVAAARKRQLEMMERELRKA